MAYILKAGCPSQQVTRNVGIGPNTVAEPLQALTSWLASRLQSSAATSLAVVTQTLVVLATCHEARIILDRAGGIGYLARHLRTRTKHKDSVVSPISLMNAPAVAAAAAAAAVTASTAAAAINRSGRFKGGSANVQQVYELCFCLWTMTFEVEDNLEIRQHFHRDDAISALCDLVATAPREKVVRLALNALRNLATCNAKEGGVVEGRTFLREMMGYNLMKSIDLLKERQWTDPDIGEGKRKMTLGGRSGQMHDKGKRTLN